MRRLTINALIVITVSLHAMGALAADYFELTEHYRTIERFDRVSINVTSEFNITPEVEAFSGLADQVAHDIELYLAHRGIDVVRSGAFSDDLTRLEVILQSPFKRFGSNICNRDEVDFPRR